MRALSAAELLYCWERGLTQSPLQRGLALLSAASPERAPETLADLSIGRRDAALLTLRTWTFGAQLSCLASCPACDERLELEFDAAHIWAAQSDDPPATLSTSAAGYTACFRLPTSRDLAAIADQTSSDAARRLLLERCLLTIDHNAATSVAELPVEVEQAIAVRMAEADPQADARLALTCPACDHGWQAAFDIVSFFWGEIDAWASRTLREVHLLARAYGWTEPEILALSPLRRQLYLEMMNA